MTSKQSGDMTMANPYSVPPAPAITKIEPVTFFKQPGAHISGTEDISDLPSGNSITISIYDLSRDNALLNQTPIEVNSDGTWNATVPCQSGDSIYAMATMMVDGHQGATAQSPTYVVP